MSKARQRFKDFILGVGAALELTLLTDVLRDLALGPLERVGVALVGMGLLYAVYRYL